MIKILRQRFSCCEPASAAESPVCSYVSLNHHLIDKNVTLTTDDLSKELFRGVSKKRYTAHKELVKDDAHGPPVHRLPIALP